MRKEKAKDYREEGRKTGEKGAKVRKWQK